MSGVVSQSELQSRDSVTAKCYRLIKGPGRWQFLKEGRYFEYVEYSYLLYSYSTRSVLTVVRMYIYTHLHLPVPVPEPEAYCGLLSSGSTAR